MPAWKVFFTLVLFCVCLGLAFATLVVPMTTSAGEHRWLWLAGLLVATAVVGTLLTLFLRRASRFMR
jgi:hypothetical protein